MSEGIVFKKGGNGRFKRGHNPHNKLEIVGNRYGRLVVTGREENKGTNTMWKCLCDCGNEKIVRGSSLTSGNTLSCGCFQKSKVSEANKTHGMSCGDEYSTYTDIKSRCYNKKVRNYHRYGGRGILMCEEWKESFEKFYNDMGPKPSSRHQIDRIDNNGNYDPKNCRWVLPKDNSVNRSTSKIWCVNGKAYKSSFDAAVDNDVSQQTIINWCNSNKNNCFSMMLYGSSVFDDMKLFMTFGNQTVNEFNDSQELLYDRLIDEEHKEFSDSFDDAVMMSKESMPDYKESKAEAIKEAIDLIVVVSGWLISTGIDPQAAWDIVHGNNMAKVTEKVEKDENGKIKKSPESIKRKEQMMADLRALIDA